MDEKEKIARLLKQSKEIVFKDGKEEIKWLAGPIKNKKLLQIIKFAEDGQTDEAMINLIWFSLLRNQPDITKENVEDMPFLFDVLDVVAKVNHVEHLFPSREGRQKPDPNSSAITSKKGISRDIAKLKQNPAVKVS